jgi:prophage regulatory protein
MTDTPSTTPTIWRRKQVQLKAGLSRSTLYARIDAGLWPRPVSLGVRAVGWPDDEVQAVLRARIAGCTDDEVRGLVAKLYGARRAAVPA